MNFATLTVHREGAVLFASIAAQPMNLLGPELIRDLVAFISQAEADEAVRVIVFQSADSDFFIAHVDVGRIKAYRDEAAKLAIAPCPLKNWTNSSDQLQNESAGFPARAMLPSNIALIRLRSRRSRTFAATRICLAKASASPLYRNASGPR